MHSKRHRNWLRSMAVLCSFLLVPGDVLPMLAQDAAAPAPEAAKFPPEQLDSLVAPIALYPDPLLANVLAASTYPLEIVQLQQWLEKNKNLKDKALADAVAKQGWDPTVQGLAGMPDVVKKLSSDIKYTTDLGNAFLAQQSDVMDAVQRMRKKAEEKGNLKSNEQVKVETKVVESKQVVVIQQSNPQVVYVPSYDPVVVYGAPPPAYPYPPPGYYAAGMALSFGVGVAMGAMWSGGWCCNSGWGGNNTVNINNNNTFVNNSNRTNNVRGGNTNVGSGNRGGNTWQHNASHRGAAPYGDRATANKFGGSTRGGNRGGVGDNRGGVGGNRGGVGDNRGGVGGNRGGVGDNRGGVGDNRGGAGGNRGGVGDNRGSGGLGGDRGGSGAANRGGGGGDRVGNRSVGGGGGGSSAFGGGGGSASSARASSSRGSSSFGGGGGSGGGRSRGGGGGGGGRRR